MPMNRFAAADVRNFGGNFCIDSKNEQIILLFLRVDCDEGQAMFETSEHSRVVDYLLLVMCTSNLLPTLLSERKKN